MSKVMSQVLNSFAQGKAVRVGSSGLLEPDDTPNKQGIDPTLSLIDQLMGKVDAIMAEFNVALGQINSAVKYSEAGKASERGDLAQRTLSRFSGFDEPIANAQRQLDELRASTVVTDPSDGDKIVQALREAEVRAMLPKNDPLVVRPIFMDAIERGDAITYFSIRNAPAFMNLLPRELLLEGEAIWIAKQNPKRAQAIRKLTDALDGLRRAITTAKADITKAGGLPEDDPIERVARGDVPDVLTAARTKDEDDLIEKIAKGGE